MLRLIQILEREIRAGMALLGAASIKDLKPELVSVLHLAETWTNTGIGRASELSTSSDVRQIVGVRVQFISEVWVL